MLRATSTACDADGNVVSQTDGDGNLTSYSYNSLNQQISSTNAAGQVPSYTYDGDGNLLTETKPSGAVTTNSYNSDGQLVETIYSDRTPSVTYGYDDLGEKVSMSDRTATSSWAYDSLGRETSYTNGVGQTLNYSYDLVGNEVGITYPDGETVTKGYDAANRETSLVDLSGATVGFTYDIDGNLLQTQLPNGVTDSSGYDASGDIASISDSAGAGLVFTADYTRDPAGLITSDSSQPAGQNSYQYTGLGQVCYAGSSSTSGCGSPPGGADSYQYDKAGNLTGMDGSNLAYGADDELCWVLPGGGSEDGCPTPPAGATQMSYDADGDLTTMELGGGLRTEIGYNAAGQMTSFQVGGGLATSYSYDGDGELQSDSVGNSTTNFLWDDSGDAPLLLGQSTRSGETYYVDGPSGLPVEEVLPDGATYYYSHDALGSTRALTDSTGAAVDTWDYDPYGNIDSQTGSVPNDLLYAGQLADSNSGMIYLQARWYDPALGQFTTLDPLVQATGMPYAYVDGDPINELDLNGQCGVWGSNTCWGDVANTVSHAAEAVSEVSAAVGSTWGSLCFRDPFAGNPNSTTSNGCQAEITPTEGALALGAVSVVAGGAGLAAEAGLVTGSFASAETLGYVSAGAGLAASSPDVEACVTTHAASSCLGAAFGLAGAFGGLGAELRQLAMGFKLAFLAGGLVSAGTDFGQWLSEEARQC
ncbi:MAG: RHS repeat-associated core domain-containing protein [Candidatus Dormibacteria bacterium]